MVHEKDKNRILSSNGMYITQKQLQNEENRFFATMIILGNTDTEDNYIEVNASYKKSWEDRYLSIE